MTIKASLFSILLISTCFLQNDKQKVEDINESAFEAKLNDIQRSFSFKNFVIENDKVKIDVNQIDSLTFQSLYKTYYKKEDTLKAIFDWKEAQKKIGNLVTTKTLDDDWVSISQIKFRKSDTVYVFENPEEYYHEECFFDAYFPEEDILLTEGGHSSDLSFNLTTGHTTDLVGNPRYNITSPRKKYRVTGWFGGQECVSYFLQKKTGKRFEKIADLEYEDPDSFGICYFEDAFWKNDTEFYYSIKTYPYYTNDMVMEFYQVIIKERLSK